MDRGQMRAGLGVVAWYLGLIVALTWPVAANIRTQIVGHEYAGPWRTIWAHWWTLARLRADGVWPLDAPEIAFPRGGSFSSIAPVDDLISLPLQPLFGVAAAYNIVVMGNLLLGCGGAYLLARACGFSAGAALAAGTVFGFNAFSLSYGVASAVVETATIGWVALFFAAMVWLVKRPGPAAAVITGTAYAVMSVACLYWSVMAALFVPVVAVGAVLDRRARGERTLPGALVGWVALAIAVASALFLPTVWALLSTYSAEGSLLGGYSERKQEMLDAGVLAQLAHDYATLGGYLLPGKGQVAVHQGLDVLVQTTYAGWLAIGVAWAGYRPGARRWLLVGLAAALLSLGPFLFLSTDSFRGTVVPWWDWLRTLVPPTRMITSYVRFSVFFYLGLAMLVASGVDRIRTRLSRPWVVGPLVSLAVLAELVLLSPVPSPIPSAEARIPEISRALAKLPRPGAVLDWPQYYPGRRNEISRWFFYQYAHRRPIPYDFAPASYLPSPLESNAFYAALEKMTYGPTYDSGAWNERTLYSVGTGLDELRGMGFAYLAVHPSFIDPRNVARVDRWLESRLARVATASDGATLWDFGDVDRYDE